MSKITADMTPAREKLARWCGYKPKDDGWWTSDDGGWCHPEAYLSSPAFAFEEVAPKLEKRKDVAGIHISLGEQGPGWTAGIFAIAGEFEAIADTPHEALLLAAEKVVEAMEQEDKT